MNTAWHEEASIGERGNPRISDQHIVNKIREAVLFQRLPPGTRLPEAALGEIFGVSRSVVRRALTRLDGAHVVTLAPNQVARICAPSIEETRETFAVRRLVEGEAVALVAGRLTPVQLEALENEVEQEIAAHRRGDEGARTEHSLNIHHALAAHCPNRILGSVLNDLILRTSIVIALYKSQGLTSCYLEGDHFTLLSCLRDGESEAARSSVVRHLLNLENLMDLRSRGARIDLVEILGSGLAKKLS